MKEKIEQLIAEGEGFTFEENSISHDYGTFSTPCVKLQSWIAECEDFLIQNYGRESTPWRIFERVKLDHFEGYEIHEFNKEKTKLLSALNSCLRISSIIKINESKVDLDLTKVFIVHGHDALLKSEVARFIEKLNLEVIILHEQASSGKTIIEKIEEHSNVGFGVVLYTSCDVGAKKEENPSLKPRARQNVVFEHGYLIGKIGRQNVCALVKGNIEKPNDISGVVYISVEAEWKLDLAKELRNSGYEIDMNLVI
ncbi:MAG: putative nucleotide-binding protein [Halioglobus sp.]|jgi:predicted nucleotide-binding protein